MNKKGRKLVVILAVMIQVMLGVLFGFSDVPISSGVCFVIWCACAMMICRCVEAPSMI